MAQKDVKIKVATDVEMKRVEALEDKIKELKNQRLQMRIEANTAALEDIDSRIDQLQAKILQKTAFGLSDEEIKQAEAELQSLKEQRISLEIALNDDALEVAKAEVEELDGTSINIDMQTSMQNISQGITQAKQGFSELKDNVDEVSQAGIQAEQNFAFLELNLGAEKARDTMQQISDIVASMPGDDNTMRSVLSTAQALGNDLNPDEMRAATATMADYMAGSATMGKQAVESQQDIMKYLLDGNTAELERGSIVSAHVDKLKEADTFMERQAAMQEVLNELGYGGISQVDTMINKQAEWEGMIYNSQDALSSMWLGAEKGAMDFVLKLNDASNGVLGIGIVAGQMVAGPMIDLLSGVGQIGTGLKGMKDGIGILKELKIVTYAQAAASKIAAAAQWLWNFAVIENPIVLVVIALIALVAAIIWAYNNVDWFREMVDNAFASLQQLAAQIWDNILPVIQWLSDQFNQFTQQLGLNTNDWIQAVLAFILFIPQLPMKLGEVLVNAIAKALGFGDNFVQTMRDSATNAVKAFGDAIAGLSDKLKEELDAMLRMAQDFYDNLPWWLKGAASGGVAGWILSSGEHSPGYMYEAFHGELTAMENRARETSQTLPSYMSLTGQGIVNGFDPNLNTGSNAGGAGNITINMEIGSVDNEDRVREIVDAVRRELSWNNATAGRTV